ATGEEAGLVHEVRGDVEDQAGHPRPDRERDEQGMHRMTVRSREHGHGPLGLTQRTHHGCPPISPIIFSVISTVSQATWQISQAAIVLSHGVRRYRGSVSNEAETLSAVAVLSDDLRRRMYAFIRKAGRPVTRD